LLTRVGYSFCVCIFSLLLSLSRFACLWAPYLPPGETRPGLRESNRAMSRSPRYWA
jgi:hypothetical protein